MNRTSSRTSTNLLPSAILILAILFVLAFVAAPAMQAQTFTVIHNFIGGDGQSPVTGLTKDARGNFYGTTNEGGTHGNGTVFKLSRYGSGWVLSTLYNFAGGSDGAAPNGRIAIAADGSLYGITFSGGDNDCNCGTVYRLRPPIAPPKTALSQWNETVIHRFSGWSGNDGAYPQGDLTFDQAGNIYGTAGDGGNGPWNGVVYELSPSGDSWTETVLHYFQQNNGPNPIGGVVMDRSGNLYGVTANGSSPTDCGRVYELSPSGSGWTEHTLHIINCTSDGANPRGGLILDSAGSIYGTTSGGNTTGGTAGATVFELTPSQHGWSFNLLYTFPGNTYGAGPWDKLAMDIAGNIYGTTEYEGPYNVGNIFELAPSGSAWIYNSLHDFTGRNDGGHPVSNLVFDAYGAFYGTANSGGNQCVRDGGCGVVFEMTP